MWDVIVIILVSVASFAASFAAFYMLVWIGAQAWFQVKREHTRQTIRDLVDDKEGEAR